MLKFTKITALLLTAALGFNTAAVASVEASLANICTIVAADDKNELRKKMRDISADYSLKLRDYYSGISCNGKSLIKTAIANNAIEVGTLLVKKMPSSDLGAPETDGKTLQAWITENSLQEHQVAQALLSRL